MQNRDAASPEAGNDRLVADRYRLLSVLGEGGMGTVWRAHDEVLHREVAVKEVRASAELPPELSTRMYARLEREAWAAARINARGVVTVYDVASFDGRPWIVMELIRGRSLADVMNDEGPLPPKDVARIGLEVLTALRAAHSAGVLHRDVKPGNVLISDEGRVVLTDFGIANVEGDTALTMTGEIVGSPEYLAPERALGRTPGPASDLWSLGALLYAAVEGRSPFRRTSVLSTLRAVVDDALPPPHRAGPLTFLIEGLMLKDPDARMTSERAAQGLRVVANGPGILPEASFSSGAAAATTAGTAALTAGEGFGAAVAAAAGDAAPTQVAETSADAVIATGSSSAESVAVQPAAQTPPDPRAPAAPVPQTVATAERVTLSSLAPPPVEAGFGPATTEPGPGGEPHGRTRRRRLAYVIGAGATVVVLVGGGLAYALGGTGDQGKASEPVSVAVAGGSTVYDGTCPAEDGQAPWFTATFTAVRPPVQISYRWVSQNGAVVDPQWRTLTFREGGPNTQLDTVRLSTYARQGTLRSAMAVQIRSPFDIKSNAVPFSVTCRPGDE